MPEIVFNTKRRTLLRLSSLGLGFLSGIPLATIAKPSKGEELILAVDRLRGYQNQPFQFSIRTVSYMPGREPEDNRLDVYFRNHKQVLVLFRAPKQVEGRRLLLDSTDMWLALPSSKRVLRISPLQRLTGEASNGDIVNTDLLDYAPTSVEEVQVEGRGVYRLKIAAKSERAAYRDIELLIDRATTRPLKSLHYAASGKLLKIAHYNTFKKFGDRDFVERMLLVNPVFQDQYTWMIYGNYRLVDLPESLFRKETLTDVVL